MTVAALVISTVALLVVTVAGLALVEVLQEVQQVRTFAGLHDEAQPVSVGDAIGLPAAELGVDFEPVAGIILFVSPRCSSCHKLVETFSKRPPENLHVVVTAVERTSAVTWAQSLLMPSDMYTVDEDQGIADRSGIASTPVALLIQGGVVSRAATAPSRRALDALMDEASQASSKSPRVASGR